MLVEIDMAKIILFFLLSYFVIKIIRTFLKVRVVRFDNFESLKSRQNEIDITDKVKIVPLDDEKNTRGN
jgi:hypothetical protein